MTYLDVQTEIALVTSAQQGDPAAVATLLDAFRPLLRRMAGEARARLADSRLDVEDLTSVARIAMMRAIETHDPRCGRLATFTQLRVREALADEIAAMAYPVAVPGRTLRDYFAEEKDGAMRGARDTHAAVRAATAPAVDITAPAGDLPDRVHPDNPPDPDGMPAQVGAALAGLSAREAHLVDLTYGFTGETLTAAEASVRMGLSKRRYFEIKRQALAKLAAALAPGSPAPVNAIADAA